MTSPFEAILYRALHRITRSHAEAIPKRFLCLFLPPDPVVIDAGAHDGADTAAMAALWPGGVIHAFEPIPEVFKRLVETTHRLENVCCYPAALADCVGQTEMYVSAGGGDASSSLLRPKEHLEVSPHVRFDRTAVVETMTLDAWAEANGIHRVDLLWLDMQGGELAAMKAGTRILATVKVIHLEVALLELYEGNPLFPEVREWLEAQGFRMSVAQFADKTSGNALFVRRDVRLSLRPLLPAVQRFVCRIGRRRIAVGVV